MLTIEEKELIMSFPLNYTENALSKAEKKLAGEASDDTRHTLIGNSWHIGVISLLLQPLCEGLNLCPRREVQEVVDLLRPGSARSIGGLLFRPDLNRQVPFKRLEPVADEERTLVTKLALQVSCKGSDILLKSCSEPLPSTHRFRTSIPARLWRWKTVCGWRWKGFDSTESEHINKLEMRAVYTAIKWRLFKQKISQCRCLHLVDSMVSLQILNKGRTSSRKLRALSKRIGALLVAGRLLLILAYVHTSQNPADRPSRAPRKRKWSSK